jgi:hypothetical protein
MTFAGASLRGPRRKMDDKQMEKKAVAPKPIQNGRQDEYADDGKEVTPS